MAASWLLKRCCSTAATETTKGTRWQRLINSRAGVWCRSLLSDYKEACREAVLGARERPLKASLYLGLLGGVYACHYTNPDDASFESSLRETSNRLALLSPWIRNGTSDGHIQTLVKLRNEGRLRYASLGIASLTYYTDYDSESSLYEARCSAISVPWAELPKRVLDVGFTGRWWVLDHKMKDFDINEEEFKHLPPALVAAVPSSPQITERNERMHQESWKAVVMEDESDELDGVQKAMDTPVKGIERNTINKEQTS
ncbi:mitochondrial import inner membrane translocase subunit Tim29-like [Carassius carassius]|uniref:mitochondrial import inner membrane translocase subunit Tim29-like n=1 Tax=Carassius carassius TaxID=217509 RepID=UPI002868E8DC|nr:mitochondrial import inner membrane translocase subunit Tim29-like [Carassius carassius]